MSKYYGQLTGMARTTATRRGSAKSGVKSSVQSYDGSITLHLRDNRWGERQLRVLHSEASDNTGECIFDGPMDEFVRMCLRHEPEEF